MIMTITRPLLCLPTVILCFISSSSLVDGSSLGGEKAFYHETKFPDRSVSHRTNVCPEWERFNNGTVPLRDALAGLQLSALMSWSEDSFFYYDEINGINSEYPGIEPVLLDELARRAGFTWRNSFGTFTFPPPENVTNTEVLVWGIDTYDIFGSFWTVKISRMTKGVDYIEPWYDGSPILIGKAVVIDEETSTEINIWNWTRPYDSGVWAMTIITIIISAFVYQILEWFADDRQDRTMWEWCQENLYLSTINFTQAYEYQPKTISMRIFGISMAIWALVMTATYTANLASLLVDRRPPPPGPETIDEVFRLGYSVCTLAGSSVDSFLAETYPKLKRVPKREHSAMYQGIHEEECDFVADTATSWLERKDHKANNPHCDLFWVGGDRKLKDRSSAMVTKADMGQYCSGFIREVLNVHMLEMIEEGFLKEAWKNEHGRTQDLDCSVNPNPSEGEAAASRRRLNLRAFAQQQPDNGQHHHNHHRERNNHQNRMLKAGGGATGGAVAIAAAAASEDDRKLSVEQMIGTFVFHWGLMIIALVLAGLNALYQKYGEPKWKAVRENLASEVQGDNEGGSVDTPLSLDESHWKTSTTRTKVGVSALFDSETTRNSSSSSTNQQQKQMEAAMEERLQRYLKENLKKHEMKMLLLDSLLQEKMEASGLGSGRSRGGGTQSTEDDQTTTSTFNLPFGKVIAEDSSCSEVDI